MTLSLHRTHKILLLLLLLAVFLIPFVITGVRAQPGPSTFDAGAGVLDKAKTSPAETISPSTVNIGQFAGKTIVSIPVR